jgi:hypothetical protein
MKYRRSDEDDERNEWKRSKSTDLSAVKTCPKRQNQNIRTAGVSSFSNSYDASL